MSSMKVKAKEKDGIVEVKALLNRLGNTRPKIAILSATESAIASVPSSMDAAALVEWARAELADVDVSGPLAFDLIMSPEAAATKKLTDDPVAGHADAIIVPDIVSGNALFKAFVYFTGGCAAGLVTGAKVPILLTSRADPPFCASTPVTNPKGLNARSIAYSPDWVERCQPRRLFAWAASRVIRDSCTCWCTGKTALSKP